MPRRGDEAGYDCMPVCAFCIQYLQITAGGKTFLRSVPLSKLKNYMQAYGLKINTGVIEKDDIINAIITARTENGCLPRSNENYYRKHTVPSGQISRPRGLFSRPERVQPQQNLDPRAGWSRTNNFARPDLQPDDLQLDATRQWNAHQDHLRQQEQRQRETRNQYAPPPGPPPYATYNSPRRNANANASIHNAYSAFQNQRPSSVPFESPRTYTNQNYPSSTPNQRPNPSPTTRPATTGPTVSPSQPPHQRPPQQQSQPRPPRPQAPTLDELLAMQEEEITGLSIGVLKDILDDNHVRPGLVLEKGELVERVKALVVAERRERVHAEAIREREEFEAQEREWAARERERAVREAREREAREKAEAEERQRHRDMYRTTVESASDSDGDDSAPGHSASSADYIRAHSHSPSPVPDAPKEQHQQKSEEQEPVNRSRSPSPPSTKSQERSGLCVVCQDEDANIVIVDCGHLALCRACSDLVWSSTRECPLCRTRIVTQARFLRVFKS